MKRLAEKLLTFLRIGRRVETQVPPRPKGRERTDHVILLDGTMSSLDYGQETNIGLIYRLLQSQGSRARVSLYYEAGVQWHAWRHTPDVAFGRGINRQIRRAYGWLASRYRPGDRIFLFGYSRGAYAVRSLAGVIDRVGLVRADCATERNILLAYRYYQSPVERPAQKEFVRRFCHPAAGIEMIGVFDTVKALGMRLPFLWMLTERQHLFHSHALGPSVRNGFHALALDETRSVYEPVMWESRPGAEGRLEQVWFRGTHGDVGGQLSGFTEARPLSNIPLVWMLQGAQETGLPLPPDWRDWFPADPDAPSVGGWRGWGKLFMLRAPRVAGRDPSERLHPAAIGRRRPRALLRPRLRTEAAAQRAAAIARAGGRGRSAALQDDAGGGAGRIDPAIGQPADLGPRHGG